MEIEKMNRLIELSIREINLRGIENELTYPEGEELCQLIEEYKNEK